MKVSWLIGGALLASGCGGTGGTEGAGPGNPPREVPSTSSGGTERPGARAASTTVLASPGPVDKVDLLLMIDNSISMSDKQQILSAALPDLMSRLVNPSCVDAQGNSYPPPAEGSATCPAGQFQEFQPIADIHVGVVSSSLGDVGANSACPTQGYPQYAADRVDMAHLLGSLERSRADSTPQGFLEWRAGSTRADEFNRNFQQMVRDVGENGCGWEASLEAWYRFLVDPVPYRELARVQCPGSDSSGANCVQRVTGPDGRFLLDETLLAQRAAFLRPDSLVAIVMLSDENDCSIQVGPQSWTVLQTQDMRPMFKGSSACAQDPNAKCCYSCPLEPPAGCPRDPACTEDAANPNRLAPELDGQNLRCFQQKRRFGVDLLYPTQRYVNALTQRELCWNALDLSLEGCDAEDILLNPLFESGRPVSRVFLGGILGVPWQALDAARTTSGPSGTDGPLGRFKTYAELERDGAWSQILGDPGVAWQARTRSLGEVLGSAEVLPTLPQMVESASPRPGITLGNALNGRDYDTTQGTAISEFSVPGADDLQYACIFPLAVPRDCSVLDPSVDNCDCYPGVLDRPLCEQTPGASPPGTTQYWAKAYPSLRQLRVLQGHGAQTGHSIVASICARNVNDPSRPDYGYRPAISAVVNGMKEGLAAPAAPQTE